MVPNAAQTCREHLRFMQWADLRMIQAVAENTPAEIAVLRHIYHAEEVWCRRVHGERDIQITDLTPIDSLAELQRLWPEMHRRWLAWADALEDFDQLIPHRNLKGEEFNMPAWQIVLHLVNHGSFHRGQVAASLRAAGIAPPPTDLIIYYRTEYHRPV